MFTCSFKVHNQMVFELYLFQHTVVEIENVSLNHQELKTKSLCLCKIKRKQYLEQASYQKTLQKFVTDPWRRKINFNSECFHFQQDGALPLVANATLAILKTTFGDIILSRRAEHNWAPQSPDKTPLYIFLWGYLKNNI